MTNSSPNALQRTLQKTFSLGEGLMGQSRTWIEDWMGRVKGVDDTQLNTFMDMAESYRELLEYLAIHPYRLISAETTLVRQHASLLGNLVRKALGRDVDPVIQPDREDRRFADSDWEDKWLFDYLKQAYLLNAKAVLDIAEHAEGPQVPHHDQLVFYTRQIVNALSPSNFPLTNPEVLREILSSGGVNLIEGARQFWADFKRNPKLLNISMTDYSAFEVGKNVATTPGKVVFENRLMQLIQYTPSTETVREIPLLILPPWINKFYILDLKPKNSLIKWLVDQGFTVFVVSWVNPGPSYRDTTFDDYIVQGALAAVDAVQRETGAAQVNAIGYCIGGTLLASTLAWLARKGRQPIRSATYLTTLTDFSDPGGIGVFVNEHAISAIEKRLEKTGYFDGRAMAFSFNLLRENDLFWSFFVNNYLKGQKPSAFDLLYWNSDGTNLPAAMHAYYLRNMYLENRLIKPNGLTLAGEPIDLRCIQAPVFFLSTVQDHIAKWKSTYKGAVVHGGQTRFVLSGSGHIAGVVNPPSQNKYGYWTNDALPDSADAWLKGAVQHDGSWWPEWKRWVDTYAGAEVPARQPGAGGLGVIEDAPGRYVRQRIADVLAADKG